MNPLRQQDQMETVPAGIEMVGIRQMADALGIPEMSLYKRRLRGDFPPSYKIGGTIRVDRRDFLAWLETKREVA